MIGKEKLIKQRVFIIRLKNRQRLCIAGKGRIVQELKDSDIERPH